MLFFLLTKNRPQECRVTGKQLSTVILQGLAVPLDMYSVTI